MHLYENCLKQMLNYIIIGKHLSIQSINGCFIRKRAWIKTQFDIDSSTKLVRKTPICVHQHKHSHSLTKTEFAYYDVYLMAFTRVISTRATSPPSLIAHSTVSNYIFIVYGLFLARRKHTHYH